MDETPWRSIEERAGLPDPPPPSLPEASRRDLLRLMGASLALAGAAGCDRGPPETAVPYVRQPEELVPGRPLFYATATLLDGMAQPVLATVHEGRPTRLDGNPRHPLVEGRIDPFAQAAVLALHDPDRSRVDWGAFDAARPGIIEGWRRTGGEGLRLLTGAVGSPTLLRQIADFQRAYPGARWHAFEPVGRFDRVEALAAATGRPLDLRHHLDRAAVVVSLGEDLLGPGPWQVPHARAWTKARAAVRGGDAAAFRLLVAEPTPTLTGAVADRRLRVDAGRLPALLAALAQELGVGAGMAPLDEAERAWVAEAAAALRGNAGRSLLAAGPMLPDGYQALTVAINATLGNVGRTLDLVEPVTPLPPDGALSLPALVEDMAEGRVQALVMLGVNPVYAAPGDLDVQAALAKVGLTIHAGLHRDETARLCTWHLPLAHELESWGDARAADGTATILQPLMRPAHGRPLHALMAQLLGRSDGDEEAVRATWLDAWTGTGFEARWQEALRQGFVPDSAPPPVSAAVEPPDLPPLEEAAGLDLLFQPDPSVWDGRFANLAWLQELPKPLTKLTWGNAAMVAPELAAELGLSTGDRVEIAAAGASVEAPVWILPGQAPRTVTVHLGYGREAAGAVGDGHGFNACRLRRTDAPWLLRGAELRRLGDGAVLASTQVHHRMEGRDLIRSVAPGAEAAAGQRAPQASLYPDRPRGEQAWGMVIDVDACIGCNACMVACQAENNVPVVGKEQVLRGREMHWLRIDRYFAGDAAAPRTLFQPVPCMHCEKAPCEMGCPVNATVHGPDGLNQMVYNRCIGTRTCGAYCPYEVRRFNYLDYAEAEGPRNPNVTVRSRGVMEKCTYCVQRIAAARIAAGGEGRPIPRDAVRTACQSACPTDAIVFGDLNDPESAVSQARRSPRHYAMLHALGTRPRTTYLAKVET